MQQGETEYIKKGMSAVEQLTAGSQLFVSESGLGLDVLEAFAEFLDMDVANGNASKDTVRGYMSQVGMWVQWCSQNGVNPTVAKKEDIKAYRAYLVDQNYKSSSIEHKLTVLRRFYTSAVNKGLRPDNPVIGVKAHRNDYDPYDFRCLSDKQLRQLFEEIQYDNPEKELRDKVIIGMMSLQMLRTVEIERACVEDVTSDGVYITMQVRGKGHPRTIGLRQDVAENLFRYLEIRAQAKPDSYGTPLFAATGNRSKGQRISRRGIRQIVDFYLRKADLKRKGLSGHALRHTGATLAYESTKDIRAVQDVLGHRDPKTTSRYTHRIDSLKNNPAAAIQVFL